MNVSIGIDLIFLDGVSHGLDWGLFEWGRGVENPLVTWELVRLRLVD